MNGRDYVRSRQHVLRSFLQKGYGRQGDDFESEPAARDVSVMSTHSCVFFWVFPRRPIVVCRRFGTLYQFHLQGLDVEYEV